MGFVQSQFFSTTYTGLVDYYDVTNINLDSSTEKIVIVLAYKDYDITTTTPTYTLTWDYGGTDESPTYISGSNASESYGGDRHQGAQIHYLDNPTIATNATLRIDHPDAPLSTGSWALDVAIYEFDSEADTGASGDVGTFTSGASATHEITLTTRDSDSYLVMGAAHQVADANPFTPNASTTEDVDDDNNINAAIFFGHASGNGSDVTIGYDVTTQRRAGNSAYEVLITTGGGGETEARTPSMMLMGVG